MIEQNHECYVSLEVAKLLKEAGFNWMCSSLYGMDVRHNGTPIDEDEEYELKASGRGNEIEYIDGGAVYNIYNNNKDPYCYSRPTIDIAQRWLREVKSIEAVPWRWPTKVLFVNGYKPWSYKLIEYQDLEGVDIEDFNASGEDYFSTYEEALEAGIKKAIELILEEGE